MAVLVAAAAPAPPELRDDGRDRSDGVIRPGMEAALRWRPEGEARPSEAVVEAAAVEDNSEVVSGCGADGERCWCRW